MEIRLLAESDLAAACEINNGAVPAVGEADLVKMHHLFAESLVALGAYDSDVLAGFSITFAPGADYHSVNYLWFCERYTDFAYLDRIAIRPSYQGRGIGADLYAELERRLDVDWLACEVNLRPPNDGSLRFHHRIGFTEVGQQETDYGYLVSMLAKDLRSTANVLGYRRFARCARWVLAGRAGVR